MNWFQRHWVFLLLTSLFAGLVLTFYVYFSSQFVTKSEPFELIPSESNWVLVINENDLSSIDANELSAITTVNFPIKAFTEYFNNQSALDGMNCWLFELEGNVYFVLPDGKNEAAIEQLSSQLRDLKLVRSNGFILFASIEYKPISLEASIQSDHSFFCVFEKHSLDARFSLFRKSQGTWNLWEMFDRSQKSQLIQISCTPSKPDSLNGTFQAIGKLPTDADDVYVRHYGNGQLLLELTFQQVDSSLQKLFLAKEIEHESLLAESFKEWFIPNATGELGSFKMPNLGEERIYFLGINEVSAEKWLSDSTAQLVKAFPLGARFILDKTVQNESPVFGIVKNGVLFFSYNSELLKGLNDYLNVSSNITSLDQFKNFPLGGELILRPNFESNQLKAMGVNQAWFHGTYDEGYVKWIQLLGSEKSVQPEPVVVDSSIEENTSSELIFTVDNHLTSEKNEVHCSGNKLRWIENGNVRFEFECKSEIRDVKQIDQRGNGKLQVLILTHGGLDLCDVNGTRLSGFPVAVEQGTNGVWLVTNHKNPESCRILVASNVNKILNLRVNGQSASGWQSPIFSSEIKLIEESKEGYAVLCSNGEKSQLKKTGIRIK